MQVRITGSQHLPYSFIPTLTILIAIGTHIGTFTNWLISFVSSASLREICLRVPSCFFVNKPDESHCAYAGQWLYLPAPAPTERRRSIKTLLRTTVLDVYSSRVQSLETPASSGRQKNH